MRVVAYDGGIAGINAVPDELKPLKRFAIPELISEVATRYAVATIPTLEEAKKTGAKFRDATFRSGHELINILEIGIFNDGLGVTATDTVAAEIVLEDLYSWLQSRFHFRKPPNGIKRVYQSDLIVSFDNNPARVLDPLAALLLP